MKPWLWVVYSQYYTVFSLCPDRKADQIDSLQGGNFTGAVICDRAKLYLGFQMIQWCWAHLRRDFVALSDTHSSINCIEQEFVELAGERFYY